MAKKKPVLCTVRNRLKKSAQSHYRHKPDFLTTAHVIIRQQQLLTQQTAL